MIPFKDILLEAMKPGVANTVFAKFGVRNAAVLDKGKLRKYYMALVKKHHPDKGGNDEDMRWINAAYDVLYPVAKDVPDVELKAEDAIVNIEFRDINTKEVLDMGQCNHSEFTQMMDKIDPDIRNTEPPNNYNKLEDKWLVPTVIVYMYPEDFYPLAPELEPFFKH